MAYTFNRTTGAITLAFALISSLVLFGTVNQPPVELPTIKKIRVLLAEHDLDSKPHLVIKAPKLGMVLSSPSESEKGVVFDAHELDLLCENNHLYLRCTDNKHRGLKHESLEIASPHRKLTISGKTYQGNLTIRIDRHHKKVLIINTLPLEEYVSAVVCSEAIPTWPLETLKLQAIVSRTYAAYLMTQARSKNPLYKYYDIRNTNIHQVYGGDHSHTLIKQAVEETQDMVLSYKGKFALTMFDICCGGCIPAHMRCRDASKPYLLRSEKCLYCTKSPRYQWKVDLFAKSFLDTLKKHPTLSDKLKPITQLTDIKLQDADKAGIVHKVKLTGTNNRHVTISGRDIRRSFISSMRSLQFAIKKVRDSVVITGFGDGHQRGLCQWGCKELVSRGWDSRRILQFYYPGATLSRLA